MKSYIRLLILFGLLIISVGIIIRKGMLKLNDDPIAKKVFSPKQNSLILGTSRAALLDGQIISNELNLEEEYFSPVFNYAFNLGASPYGASYIESIKRKLRTEKNNQKNVFILCIDPWALSASKLRQNDSLPFHEAQTFIIFNTDQPFAKLKYFKSYFSNPFYTLFLPKKTTSSQHERPSKEHIKKHLNGKIEAYKTFNATHNELSEIRIQQLDSLIHFLKNFGKVYLVKLPVAQEMIDLEKWYAPNFNNKINKLRSSNGIELIDFYPFCMQFLCPDGNHLFYQDAQVVSQIIGDVIRLDHESIFDRKNSNLLEKYVLLKKDSILNH